MTWVWSFRLVSSVYREDNYASFKKNIYLVITLYAGCVYVHDFIPPHRARWADPLGRLPLSEDTNAPTGDCSPLKPTQLVRRWNGDLNHFQGRGRGGGSNAKLWLQGHRKNER